MSAKGKGRGRGRGRGRGKAVVAEVENGAEEASSIELDIPSPPPAAVITASPKRSSLRRLRSSKPAPDTLEVADTVVKKDEAEKMDESLEDEKQDGTVEDAEMVSEDEYFGEPKEPLDTEAVSDDELKEEAQGMPETEAVSDDELPADKRKKAKVAEAEAVSEDELPDDLEKKQKSAAAAEEAADGKNENKRKLPEGEYDPSSPTSEHSADGAPAAKKQAVGEGKSPKASGKKTLPELDKYWKPVKDDPSDFTGWTYLLQYVDQENDIDVAREAYDAFLAHYPYCYGYWRKYADLEKRKGNIEICEQVFERGLKAIPLSVDLWLHYLNYCKSSKPDDKDYIRGQFERAIESCGLEFRSDRLWESYIKWEKDQKNLANITSLYDRLLAIPTQGYTNHFDTFQDHVSGNPPQTILGLDDFLELRRLVVTEMKANEKSVKPADDAPPGGEPDAEKEEESTALLTAKMEEETSALREKILSQRRKQHKQTVTAVAARWNYEEGIKRPYFHVKPLERCQLKNWKEYLDFEIEQGDEKRIITLFERCLIACALYEEFWVRYIRYLEGLTGERTPQIRDVYERACLIHHKKKPNLHLQWAVFEESDGNFDKAATILETLDASTPNMLQVAYRRINLERRRGEYDRAAELYEHYLNVHKSNKAIITNMTVKYARFLWKMMNKIDKSIEILESGVEKDKDNTRLYLQLIDMCLQKSPVDEDKIIGILDKFLEKEGDAEQKVMFAQRKIEFLEDFGTTIAKVQKAQDDFQKYIKQVKDKKKKSEDAPAAGSAKKSKTDGQASNTPAPPIPSGPPPATSANSNFSQSSYGYYGQYPAATGDASSSSYANNYPAGYNNYSGWNNYQAGSYGSYGQNWPGYYPNY